MLKKKIYIYETQTYARPRNAIFNSGTKRIEKKKAMEKFRKKWNVNGRTSCYNVDGHGMDLKTLSSFPKKKQKRVRESLQVFTRSKSVGPTSRNRPTSEQCVRTTPRVPFSPSEAGKCSRDRSIGIAKTFRKGVYQPDLAVEVWMDRTHYICRTTFRNTQFRPKKQTVGPTVNSTNDIRLLSTVEFLAIR